MTATTTCNTKTFYFIKRNIRYVNTSNSLTIDRPLRKQELDNGDIAIVEGTPTDCVYLGVNHLVRPR